MGFFLLVDSSCQLSTIVGSVEKQKSFTTECLMALIPLAAGHHIPLMGCKSNLLHYLGKKSKNDNTKKISIFLLCICKKFCNCGES